MRLAQALLLAAAASASLSAQTYVLNESSAIEFALDNDLVIAAESLDPLVAYQLLRQARSLYDPTVSASYGIHGDEREDIDKNDRASLGLSGDTLYGTGFGLSLNGNRARSGMFSALDAVETDVSITLIQPLLRDFGGIQKRATLKIARNDYEVARLDYAQLVMNLVATSLLSYYDLYRAHRQVDVSQRSRDLAEQLLKDNQIRVDAGTMAQTDLFVAESELRLRDEVYVVAQSNYDALVSQIKSLYSDATGEALDQVVIEVEAPSSPEQIVLDVEADLRESFDLRPDFRQAQIFVQSAEYALKAARLGRLPQLDLEASYGVRGSGAEYEDGVRDLDGADDPVYDLSLAMSYPIGNRNRSAAARIAAIQVEQARVVHSRLEQSLRLGVRNAAAQVAYNWRRVEISRRALVLAERSLKAEEKKLEVGTSTTITVLQLQTDLATAEGRAIQAVTDYKQSIVTYHNLIGQILRIHNVDIEELAADVQAPR